MTSVDPERRGPGNFDSVDAMVTVDDFVDELLLRLDDIMGEGDEANPDQRGESELMPTLALLIAAMTEAQDCPVEPPTVREWRRNYVTRFQARGRRLFVEEARYQERLQVILDTFGRLEELACRYHPDQAVDESAGRTN